MTVILSITSIAAAIYGLAVDGPAQLASGLCWDTHPISGGAKAVNGLTNNIRHFEPNGPRMSYWADEPDALGPVPLVQCCVAEDTRGVPVARNSFYDYITYCLAYLTLLLAREVDNLVVRYLTYNDLRLRGTRMKPLNVGAVALYLPAWGYESMIMCISRLLTAISWTLSLTFSIEFAVRKRKWRQNELDSSAFSIDTYVGDAFWSVSSLNTLRALPVY